MHKSNQYKGQTPIFDFVQKYARSSTARFHMPGHKGISVLGAEMYDITEIKDADSLYEADGIIAESEKFATELFGSGATFYSTEGSSQCIRAMLHLSLLYAKQKSGKSEQRPVIVAARNVHKAFIYAAALLDFDIFWIWPETEMKSLCSCNISEEYLDTVLKKLTDQKISIAAVYLTSPNYLGEMADIRRIAEVCHKYETLFLVDNAHGAYLHFLEMPMHPMDLGADICCDSAHKTLPVLTGGAYLHISSRIVSELSGQEKHALCLFGSTSPSYLIMSSLDLCNAYLNNEYKKHLSEMIQQICNVRIKLNKMGWQTEQTDPLRITLRIPDDKTGMELADHLRKHAIECEYADKEYLVLMVTPENKKEDLERLVNALGENTCSYRKGTELPMAKSEQKITIREALFSPSETVLPVNALGRICRTPTVSCPPAIPIAVPGEEITANAIELFLHYGITEIDVVKS